MSKNKPQKAMELVAVPYDVTVETVAAKVYAISGNKRIKIGFARLEASRGLWQAIFDKPGADVDLGLFANLRLAKLAVLNAWLDS